MLDHMNIHIYIVEVFVKKTTKPRIVQSNNNPPPLSGHNVTMSLRFSVWQPAENRVLWFVFTFKIEMNECSFNFREFLELYL